MYDNKPAAFSIYRHIHFLVWFGAGGWILCCHTLPHLYVIESLQEGWEGNADNQIPLNLGGSVLIGKHPFFKYIYIY